MRFDEVRVRYRQERRAVVREVILRALVGIEMSEFVEAEAKQRVPLKSMVEFIGDVLEDIEQLDESRLAGLGVTSKELNTWRQLR